VAPDARGVLLGERGLLLFASLDRLVAFLRAYAEQASLDDLLASLQLKQLITPLKTREVMLSVSAESSYRMDLLASVARLSGGLIFTGTSRHFVRYRDVASPLGYDASELLREAADLIVYDEAYQQTYTIERDIDLRSLLLRLDPIPTPSHQGSDTSQIWVTAELGVGGAITGYLYRWGVQAKVGLVEWPPSSAFDDRGVRLFVYEVHEPPERIVDLLSALPGVVVYVPATEGVAVQLGFRHPVALDSCASLFGEQTLTLLPSKGEARLVDPLPAFAPVESLVRAGLSAEGNAIVRHGAPSGGPIESSLPMRLAPSSDPWRNVVATVVPPEQREWLARLLYALPSEAFTSLRMAFGQAGEIYLLDSHGIEGIPLGTFMSAVADRVYVPAGFSLVPAVAPSVLLGLLGDREGGHVFFGHEGGSPGRVPDADFRDASRAILDEISTRVVSAAAPVEDPPLELLQYAEARRLPLFGLPKAEPAKSNDPSEADS